jgi:hypothetical protein
VSIESNPRVGLLEQLKAATSLEQVKTLSAEFSTFTYASDKTRRRVQRTLLAKTKELS